MLLLAVLLALPGVYFQSLERYWLASTANWRPVPVERVGVSVIDADAEQLEALVHQPYLAGNWQPLHALLGGGQPVVLALPETPLSSITEIEALLLDWQSSQEVALAPLEFEAPSVVQASLLPSNELEARRNHWLEGARRYRYWIDTERLAWFSPEGASPSLLAGLSESQHVVPVWQPWMDSVSSISYRWLDRIAVAAGWSGGIAHGSLETLVVDERGAALPLALALLQQPDLVVGSSRHGQVLIEHSPFVPSIKKIDSLLNQELPEGLVLIGDADDPRLLQLASEVGALLSEHYYAVPFSYELVSSVAVFLLLLLFWFAYPGLGVVGSLLLSGLVLVALGVMQQWLMVTHMQWFPLADTAAFIIIATVLAVVSGRRSQRERSLKQHQASLQCQLADLLLERGDLDAALDSLEGMALNEKRAARVYDIAEAFERQRQYKRAAECFALVASKKFLAKNEAFKDAQQRAEQLAAMDQSSLPSAAGGVTQTLAVAQTQPLGLGSSLKPVLGRYQVERELGRGAMGVVYLGNDPKISRQVAIKTLNYHAFEPAQLSDLKERFFREAEAAGRLDHPGIVTVYDVGEERDLAYIAMDYVDGEPVSAYINKARLLPVADVYRLIADVAEALHYAHQQGIVHRDIKPGNIMYRAKQKQVKVADFGIARIVDDSRTKTGDILGSPVYMSPEQLKGVKISGSSDLYSLGATFYQLLTGELPFQSDSLANLAYQIVNKKHKSVRDIRKALPASATRLVNKAMHKDPAKRFENGAAMAEAIRKSLARDFPREAA